MKLDDITWHATEPRKQFDGTYRLCKQLEPREQTGTWFWAAAAICGWELGRPADRPPRNIAWTRRWCVRGRGSGAVHIALSVTGTHKLCAGKLLRRENFFYHYYPVQNKCLYSIVSHFFLETDIFFFIKFTYRKLNFETELSPSHFFERMLKIEGKMKQN